MAMIVRFAFAEFHENPSFPRSTLPEKLGNKKDSKRVSMSSASLLNMGVARGSARNQVSFKQEEVK